MQKAIVSAGIALQLLFGGNAFAQGLPQPWETLRATAPLPPAVKSGRQDVGEVELYYAVYGEGEPVILLHPALGSGDSWANQIGPLSQEFQVIVLDLRGHGRSGRSTEPLSYALMAEDVLRFIKAQKLKQPAIVGWGDGATIGLELAMRYPKRIGKLIVFGLAFDRAGLQPRPDASSTFVEYVHQAQADDARLSGARDGFTRTLDQWEALWEREPNYAPADLAQLKAPTTVMVADHDEWVKPEHMTQAVSLIPGARTVTIARTSHFAPWQAPKKFNDALRLILRQ